MKNRFNKGDKVLISNQYFIDKGCVDMPFYAKVIEYIDYCDKVRIEDYKGAVYTVDAWILENDNVMSMQTQKCDTTQDKEIKKFLKIIAKELCSDDHRIARLGREKIDCALYEFESDNQRMVNELNIRRALEKYQFYARRQVERDIDILTDEEYIYRTDLIDDKAETVQIAIESFGIFQEIEDKKKNKETLEKDSLEASIKLGKAPKKSEPSFGDILDLLFTGMEDMKDMPSLGTDPFSLGEKPKKDMSDEDYEKLRLDMEDYSKPNKSQTQLMIRPKVDLPDCLIDMTALAAKGRYNEIIGREDEIDTVAETLARKEIRNPLLIGKPGAGKTAVVEELVKRAYNGEIEHLKGKRFYELRMNDLVAGTMYRGQLEQKLKDVMQVLEDDPNVVLFIDEVHMIVQAGTTAEDKNDVANALKPYLTSEISIIGATTFDEYRATFANDGALARRFNPIAIEEKTKEESVEIICKVKERFEKFHHVELSEETVRMIIDEIEARKSDNSLIAGALTAVDTICTKMKIKHISEKQAFKKWSDEVVLGVDRTNKGGKTQKIGFDMEEEFDEEIAGLDDEGTLDEEVMEDLADIILLEGKTFLRIEDKKPSEEKELDEEKETYTLSEAEEFLDLPFSEAEFNEIALKNGIKLPSRNDYINEYGDITTEGYQEYIFEYLSKALGLSDELDEDEEFDEDEEEYFEDEDLDDESDLDD